MATEKSIREQLLHLLGGGDAHMDFDEAVERFPVAHLNSHPPDSDYTPWRLAEHIRIAQWDILEFIRDPDHVSPPWPDGYWPPEGEEADERKWKKTISSFRKDRKAMQDIVKDPKINLVAPLPHAQKYTIFREVLVLADHNAYHIGEFALMRQFMGTWPKGRNS